MTRRLSLGTRRARGHLRSRLQAELHLTCQLSVFSGPGMVCFLSLGPASVVQMAFSQPLGVSLSTGTTQRWVRMGSQRRVQQ